MKSSSLLGKSKWSNSVPILQPDSNIEWIRLMRKGGSIFLKWIAYKGGIDFFFVVDCSEKEGNFSL